ncbi:MAG: hypothetical protein LH614_14485 [Pyrinomonadaceae bacterium]|nr:hypothetical protein [Pyrinomonadaceae bacterium]
MRRAKQIIKLFGIAAALLPFACCLLPSAEAHRFHTTLTRIDYNAEQKIVEISVQIFTHDLMPLLEQRSGKRVELEKMPDVDRIILKYLNENFVLTDKKDRAKTLKWVGKELDTDSVRVYLETDLTENPEGYKLKNTLFFENFPEQLNLVVCRYDGKKADLMFKVGDKIKEIVENKPATDKL